MPPPQFAKAPAPTTAPVAAKATTPAAPIAPTATKPVAVAVAPKPAAVASAAEGSDSATATKARVSKFGDVGQPVPQIQGQDLKEVLDRLVGALNGIDIAAFVAEFEATSSQSFPGNKAGRAAYRVANCVCSIAAASEMYVARAKTARKGGANKRLVSVLKLLLKSDPNAKETLLKEGIDLSGVDLDAINVD